MQHVFLLALAAVSAEVSPSSAVETMCKSPNSIRTYAQIASEDLCELCQPVTRVPLPRTVKRVQTQFIAADPGMTSGAKSSGEGASQWGIWRVDPGPRGVRLGDYAALKSAGGIAPRGGWKFDREDWWLEEHGLIMEKPQFPIPAGKYMCGRRHKFEPGGVLLLW